MLKHSSLGIFTLRFSLKSVTKQIKFNATQSYDSKICKNMLDAKYKMDNQLD